MRLTQWTDKGACLKLDNPQTDEEARTQLMEKWKLAVTKLAQFEDADDEGRLVICREKRRELERELAGDAPASR